MKKIVARIKQKVMSIHMKNGATVVTPDRFALEKRCERLKRELRSNAKSGFHRWMM